MIGSDSRKQSQGHARGARIGLAVVGVLVASVFAGAGAADAAVGWPSDPYILKSAPSWPVLPGGGPIMQPNGVRWQ